jgi:class 3 adenylate cyclase
MAVGEGSGLGGSTEGLHLTRGFLFADLRGYTAFVEAHGDEAAASLLDAYRRIVRQVVLGSGGAEIKTEGDSFYVVFPSASQAVRCGLAIVASAASWTAQEPGRPIAVGVGVHAGETAETAEGYVGMAVNLAARLCAQASAGEVLVSDTVRGLVRSSMDVTFSPRGKRRLKGITEPVTVYAASSMATPAGGGVAVSRGSEVSWSAGARKAVGPLGVGIAVIVAAVVISVVLVYGAFGASTKTEASPGASNQVGAAAVLASLNPPTAIPSGEASVNSAAPSASPLGIPIEEVNGRLALKAGTYTAVILPGAPSMTVADGGWSVVVSADGDMVLARTTTPDDRVEMRWVQALSSDVCGLQPAVPVGADPEHQFEAWARTTTGLQLSPGTIRQFGPLTSEEYDIAVVPKNACQYSTPVAVVVTPYDLGVGLFQGGGQADGTTNLSFNAGDRIRLEVTSRNGKLILIIIHAASTADFATFQPMVENLLGSLEFAP